MPGALPYLAATRLWLTAGAPRAMAFQRGLRRPRPVQEALLRSLLHRNQESDYGRRYHFDRIRSVREYQEALPVVTYEDLQEEMAAIRRGRPGVLTREPVLMLERTGGSSGPARPIPYTAALKREFQAAVAPWMADLYGRRPRLRRGGAYWSVSPVATEREVTEGGLAVGFEEDRDYFGPLERALLDRLILTPRELPRVLDLATSRYVTLRFLLQTPDLAFVSVWNPSFLTLLVESIPEHAERLIDDVRRGTLHPPQPLPDGIHRPLADRLRPRPRRAAVLAELLGRPGALPAVWPGLTTISCWASAAAAYFLPHLRRHFPTVEIQPKGLLAVEGVVSIPLSGHPGAALAVTSHFLEFVPSERPDARPLLADELETGQEYAVLLSTGGGLYRYALGDRVRVVGHLHATPLVEFLGRAGPISDLCGEKLHEERVRVVMEAAAGALRLTLDFAMLAPEWGPPPHYALFVAGSDLGPHLLQALLTRIEAGLAESHPYAYCRRLGQLGPLRGYRLPRSAARAYLDRCVALGQRAGDVKPAALHREPGWAAWFHAAGGAAAKAPSAPLPPAPPPHRGPP